MHFILYLLELLSSGPVCRRPEAPLAEMYMAFIVMFTLVYKHM